MSPLSKDEIAIMVCLISHLSRPVGLPFHWSKIHWNSVRYCLVVIFVIITDKDLVKKQDLKYHLMRSLSKEEIAFMVCLISPLRRICKFLFNLLLTYIQ